MNNNRRRSSLSSEACKYVPPWSSPYIIGIAGLSGSGKTTVAQQIIKAINTPWTVLLSMDNFYKPLNKEMSESAFKNEYDFDHPDALDWDSVFNCLKNLKEGNRTEIPVYSFSKHDRTDKILNIYGANVVILEGIYTLWDQKLLDFMDCKIFVDTDIDICYSRRLLRDIVQRGRDLPGVIKQWDSFVKPNAISYVLPTMNNADIIIPRGSDNSIAINILIEHIKKQLIIKSKQHLSYLNNLGKSLKPIPWNNIYLLPFTNQLKVIKTIILNKSTSNDNFVFYFDRLANLLITEALDHVTYKNGLQFNNKKSIKTPINYELDLIKTIFQDRPITGVCMIRGGDIFSRALRRNIPAARIGKLLIQTDSLTGEPQLHTEKLPNPYHKRINEFEDQNEGEVDDENKDNLIRSNVLLFDAQMISGVAIIMAIKVLLDNGWLEEDIIVVCYAATEKSIKRVTNAFNVKIVVGCLSLGMACQTVAIEEENEQQVQNLQNINSNSNSNSNILKNTINGDTGDNDTDWWMCNRFIDERYYGTV